MKIGLISDTHLSSSGLPRAIADAFQDVALILHAGDLTTLDVLGRLEAIAPVTAVQGNMDLPGVRLKLPSKTTVEVEGRRVGLIHGHHVPNPDRVLSTLSPANIQAIHDYLLSEFRDEAIDCIVYGHTHYALIETYRNVLMVNPGSATHGKGGRSTVGLLTISQEGMRGELVQLR